MVVKKNGSRVAAVAGSDGGSVAAVGGPVAGEFAAPEGSRVTLTLSAGDLHLVDTAVLVDGCDRSAVVSRLIQAGLSGYFSGKAVAAAPV